jgi:hypothetical protein
MSTGSKFTGLLLAGALCLPGVALADTANTQPPTTHHVRAKKKAAPLPPPLPSGTRGPVPQIPLDAIPAVQPQVTYENGLLTIVAPNSTLSDILKGVRKNTAAEIEIPATATERVVTRIGPAPAREVMADLLNGSRFNYILLGSPADANALVRVVLVAKTGPDNPPGQPAPTEANAAAAPGTVTAPPATPGEAQEVEPEDVPDDTADQSADAEQQQQSAPDQGVKTPQQLLQEMQQRQLQMQQQGQGAPGTYPTPPGMPAPHQPQPQQQDQSQQQ